MQWLIMIGSVISVAGIGGLIWCILMALKARKSSADDEQLRLRLQKVVVLNMAALGLSALGLMLVVTGILLG
ncbi:MAG: hypothetical protein A2092_08800 [Rhodobacteraceae bacterium GWE1_64_9]|nr:MAG: hypothetical protein A2092_08800 [Rhodobacteraceae bacterium GWE1_64_9]OHC48468.1 MAG: hypothetical protein A2X69_02375 [Rhodobacteraceae bacterium GWF1_65_7]HBD92298.1 hypothetical protein [Gemmobacter sp.]HBU13955.1 hypothetical protein [Gemmobacter sp.]